MMIELLPCGHKPYKCTCDPCKGCQMDHCPDCGSLGEWVEENTSPWADHPTHWLYGCGKRHYCGSNIPGVAGGWNGPCSIIKEARRYLNDLLCWSEDESDRREWDDLVAPIKEFLNK